MESLPPSLSTGGTSYSGSVKLRTILWELVPFLPISTSALFCWLWLSQVVPAEHSADWVSAIATVLALAAAAAAAWAALGQLRLLRLDAEERVKDARLAQARGIYFVSSPPPHTDKTTPGTIVLYNNTAEPVDRVDLHLRTPGEAMDFRLGLTLTPNGFEGSPQPEIAEEVAKRIRPWQMKKIESEDASGRTVGIWGPGCYELRMTFRDSSGRWWLRREGHGLEEIVGDKDDYIPRTPIPFGPKSISVSRNL